MPFRQPDDRSRYRPNCTLALNAACEVAGPLEPSAGAAHRKQLFLIRHWATVVLNVVGFVDAHSPLVATLV